MPDSIQMNSPADVREPDDFSRSDDSPPPNDNARSKFDDAMENKNKPSGRDETKSEKGGKDAEDGEDSMKDDAGGEKAEPSAASLLSSIMLKGTGAGNDRQTVAGPEARGAVKDGDVDGLVDTMVQRILVAEPQPGQGEVRLQLNDSTLRDTEITLSRGGDGSLSVTLISGDKTSLDSLSAAQQPLREVLEKFGPVTVRVQDTTIPQGDAAPFGAREAVSPDAASFGPRDASGPDAASFRPQDAARPDAKPSGPQDAARPDATVFRPQDATPLHAQDATRPDAAPLHAQDVTRQGKDDTPNARVTNAEQSRQGDNDANRRSQTWTGYKPEDA